MVIYLAVGHGDTPEGRYQPGAVAPDGTQEHVLAHRVVDTVAIFLGWSGVECYVERDAGPSHDPNYKGSAKKVNELGPRLAVEFHFDSHNAPEGGFGLYQSGSEAGLCARIARRYQERGIPTRPSQYRSDLYFLNATNCPSVIWECNRVRAHDLTEIDRMGWACAAGICDYLGVPFRDRPPEPDVVEGGKKVKFPYMDKDLPTGADGNTDWKPAPAGLTTDDLITFNAKGPYPRPRFIVHETDLGLWALVGGAPNASYRGWLWAEKI